ncbi:CBS and ACT domain-containing protein [Desulfolutivibrio sulfoxidireducens]|uniref:CBS and ACT domain-containing protein n=1 Tax=Desulfolutivibrio sulfoxidireducens TaxID=2773299 RepID=UPI00159EAC46|nr:CBS and ACT domain-containing protein [Desulfolutivibrio sulfoxidireducens]QLA17936.1 CBS domain-containing protein [Desulfolutivibrio sulfoxidireducens]QLA21513.1 CBS domain-containing protein [Desulfolutivibrio sulfoxidireducens]
MLIKDWMTKDPVVAKTGTSIMKAAKLMKENKIRRLPVVDDDGRLVGMISDRDIKEASPSKATTLDMHELYYLLSEIKVADIMTKKPLAITPDEPVERAAVIMMRNRIGGLPVVDAESKVVGIITDSDVFKVLISITGVLTGGVQMAFSLPNAEGGLKNVLDDLKAQDCRIMSILTSYPPAEQDKRHVYIRIQDLEDAPLQRLVDMLKGKYELLYWSRDNA